MKERIKDMIYKIIYNEDETFSISETNYNSIEDAQESIVYELNPYFEETCMPPYYKIYAEPAKAGGVVKYYVHESDFIEGLLDCIFIDDAGDIDAQLKAVDEEFTELGGVEEEFREMLKVR